MAGLTRQQKASKLIFSLCLLFLCIAIFYTIATRSNIRSDVWQNGLMSNKPIENQTLVIADVATTTSSENLTTSNHENIIKDNTESETLKRVEISLHGNLLDFEVADTNILRAWGLSDRSSLCKACGMLFVFPENGYYGFWMKDMNFDLDIIFLDENKKIVDIYANVSKDSYLRNTIDNPNRERGSRVYKNTTPAKYVIEINAGQSKIYGLKVGDVLQW